MYTLVRALPARQLLLQQAPSLVLAFVIAEVYYKLGSFSLECLAFLVTWGVIDAALSLVARHLAGPATRTAGAAPGR